MGLKKSGLRGSLRNVSAGVIAIHASEDFEHNDLTGNYGGGTGGFAIQDQTVDEGSFALETTSSDGSKSIVRSTFDPFARAGIRADYRLYIGSGSPTAGIAFATSVTDDGLVDGYEMRYDNVAGDGDLRIIRRDDGEFNELDLTAASISTGQWIDGYVEFQNGDITHSIDGNITTVSDSTYTDLLLAWYTLEGTVYFDNVQFSKI